MKLLSRNTDYAVRAVCYMAQHKDCVITVAKLAQALNMPRPFLRNILQVLNKKGLLKSHKGIGGGFILAINPQDMYLLDIMEAFQGPFKLNECFLKKEICPNRQSCRLKRRIDMIEHSVSSELKTITMKSIIKPIDKR